MMPMGGMMGGMGALGGGLGAFGWLLMVLFWVLIIGGIALGVWWLVQQSKPQGSLSRSNNSALEILKERYARGEIVKEEFEARKKDLV